ncbi:MAG: hypothetical protein ACO2ZM_09705, partial [Francisellaceae bacterium]
QWFNAIVQGFQFFGEFSDLYKFKERLQFNESQAIVMNQIKEEKRGGKVMGDGSINLLRTQESREGELRRIMKNIDSIDANSSKITNVWKSADVPLAKAQKTMADAVSDIEKAQVDWKSFGNILENFRLSVV